MVDLTTGQYRLLSSFFADLAKAAFSTGAIAGYLDPSLPVVQRFWYTFAGCLLSGLLLALALMYKETRGVRV